jgi:hypothetical protein
MNWTLVLEIFALAVLSISLVATAIIVIRLALTVKYNPQYLPVGTVLLVKYETTDSIGHYKFMAGNSKITAAMLMKELDSAMADGTKTITSIEYITPPKP